jgi:hypothetical protein
VVLSERERAGLNESQSPRDVNQILGYRHLVPWLSAKHGGKGEKEGTCSGASHAIQAGATRTLPHAALLLQQRRHLTTPAGKRTLGTARPQSGPLQTGGKQVNQGGEKKRYRLLRNH